MAKDTPALGKGPLPSPWPGMRRRWQMGQFLGKRATTLRGWRVATRAHKKKFKDTSAEFVKISASFEVRPFWRALE